jgi:hypothetical protein
MPAHDFTQYCRLPYFSTGDRPESFTVVSLENPPPPLPQVIPEPSTAALVVTASPLCLC